MKFNLLKLPVDPTLGMADFMPLWSGQAPSLCREMPAGKLIATLVDETEAVLRRARG